MLLASGCVEQQGKGIVGVFLTLYLLEMHRTLQWVASMKNGIVFRFSDVYC